MRDGWVYVLLAVGSVSCGFDDEPSRGVSLAPSEATETSTIAEGLRLTGVEPGEGLGVFVEYLGDGRWSLTAACDTNVSTLRCEWDVYVTSTDGTDLGFRETNLDRADWVVERGETLELHTVTADEFDSLTVLASPGAALSIGVALDVSYVGADRHPERYLYWTGQGDIVHEGAPTNPIELLPSSHAD